MQTLSSATNTEISKEVTKPIEIIALVVGATTYRESTRGAVTWNGNAYAQSGWKVESLKQLAGGAMEGVISIPNTDNAASALVLANDFADASIAIYQLYGDAPYASGDGAYLFYGVCDGATKLGLDRVFINITTEGRAREMAPRIRFDQFTSWIPPAGTVISLGGEHYRLEPRSG